MTDDLLDRRQFLLTAAALLFVAPPPGARGLGSAKDLASAPS
ncbi:MAG: hypothetical protein QGG17_05605 [Rhodospirillales bacterium]|nr:hypothetical protein [Rhodospirillales bacterium]